MKILYLAGFINEYNENIYIQRRKKAVIQKFERRGYFIDFIYNSAMKNELKLFNSDIYYSKLLPCNVFNGFIEKTHKRFFKYSKFYSKIVLKIIFNKFKLNIGDYDIVIAETWENISAILPFVKQRKIIGRIYGTGNLTECIENNRNWRKKFFFRRMAEVSNSKKVIGIIFNSTGSRSKDLFDILTKNDDKPYKPKPIYLSMPNSLFPFVSKKERRKNGKLQITQVGRMTEDHGFDLTIRIVQILLYDHKLKMDVNLVGDGPLFSEIYKMAQHAGLKNHIKMPGRLELKELISIYEKTDIAVNYYGYNPVIEALNLKAFVITKEFGEMAKILKKNFKKKIYRVVLCSNLTLNINDLLKEKYIHQVVKNILWYNNNYKSLSDSDFEPKNKLTTEDFSQVVFRNYQKLINNSRQQRL